MSTSTLRPTATSSGSPSVTGAASVHAALNDDSDSSYVTGTGAFVVALGDLTLPSGAVIKQVAIRVRTAYFLPSPSILRVALETSQIAASDVIVNWSSATWITTATAIVRASDGAQFTDAGIDSSALSFDPASNIRFYEAAVDVTYVAKPVVAPSAPTGTLTTTNTPDVEWANTLDSDGGAQTRYEVRIFTDAQYGAGGFDPATSTATDESGVVSSSAAAWEPEPLADDTYRAYVRVAQTVNGVLHWSDFAYTEFTIDVDLPGTPSLVATADDANGRIALALADNPGTAATDRFELERRLAGGDWEAVRTLDDGAIVVPYVVAVGSYQASADNTTHNLVLPAPDGGILADDLLIAVTGMDGNPTHAWPTGWTEIKDEAGNGSALRTAVAWKRAIGGESGTIALTLGSSEGGGAVILCVRGAHTSTAPEVSTGASGSGANATPDSLNPSGWGTEPTLWIAAVANDGNVAVTAAPSGYYELVNARWANASGAGVAVASRLASAASEDPGTFTHTAEDTRAFTIGVRGVNPDLTVYDYEAPNGVEVEYRARALHDYDGLFAASPWATDDASWSSSECWLKHPFEPTLNMTINVVSYPSRHRAARQGVFQPLGATYPIVVSDTRGGSTGPISISTETAAERDALDALVDSGVPLLLQVPAAAAEPDRWVIIGDAGRVRGIDKSFAVARVDTFAWTEVRQPTGVIEAWS